MEAKQGGEEFILSNPNTSAITLEYSKVALARNIEYEDNSIHPNIVTIIAIITSEKRA